MTEEYRYLSLRTVDRVHRGEISKVPVCEVAIPIPWCSCFSPPYLDPISCFTTAAGTQHSTGTSLPTHIIYFSKWINVVEPHPDPFAFETIC